MAISGVGGVPRPSIYTVGSTAKPATASATGGEKPEEVIKQATAELKLLFQDMKAGNFTPADAARLETAYKNLRTGIVMLPAKDAGLHKAALNLLDQINDLSAPSQIKVGFKTVNLSGGGTFKEAFKDGELDAWAKNFGYSASHSIGGGSYHNQLNALLHTDIPALEKLL